jgi:hypothetical protein
MTMGRMANILTIQDKLARLLAQEGVSNLRIGANSYLQQTHPDSLNWTDARLATFLESIIQPKFGVALHKKNIKLTMNGSSPTVGDLVIAIFLAVERQHKRGLVTIGHQSAVSV